MDNVVDNMFKISIKNDSKQQFFFVEFEKKN